MVDIGKVIRSGLEKKGMLQNKLAEIVGIGPSAISMWLANKAIPPGDKLIKTAQILDIVPDLFLEWDKDSISNKEKNSNQDSFIELGSKIKELEQKLSLKKAEKDLQILIVEDELGCYLTVLDALHLMDIAYLSIHAENVEKAIKVLEETKRTTALIILDRSMKGPDFLSWLASHPQFSKIPIVLTTSASDPVYKLPKCDSVLGVVYKPFTSSTFSEIVGKFDMTWPLKPRPDLVK